jgi:hypothetical protein
LESFDWEVCGHSQKLRNLRKALVVQTGSKKQLEKSKYLKIIRRSRKGFSTARKVSPWAILLGPLLKISPTEVKALENVFISMYRNLFFIF